MTRLSELPAGARGRLVSIDAASGVAQRLLALGFLPGMRIDVVGVAPFGDPMTIELDGRRVSLRRADAAAVQVEEGV